MSDLAPSLLLLVFTIALILVFRLGRLVPPDGRVYLLEKMDHSSPESIMLLVVGTLAMVLLFAIVRRNGKD